MDALQPGGDLPGLLAGSLLGRVAFGEHGVAPRVHYVAGDSVELAHGGDAGFHSPRSPFRAGAGEPLPVGEAHSLQLDPGGPDPGPPFDEPHGPATRKRRFEGRRSQAFRGAGVHAESSTWNDHHLAAALGDADGDEGLAFLEGEPAGIEEFEGVVRGGSASEQIRL
jgi:hypothetical protein